MLIGRARERSVLAELLAELPVQPARTRVFAGEAGIGKSHLVAQLGDDARAAGYEVRIGRCFADTSQRAFAPWREALGEVLDVSGAALPTGDVRARSFEAVLAALTTQARPRVVVIEDLQWADRDSLLLFLHVARFAAIARLLLVGTVRTPDFDAARNETLDEVLAELVRTPSFGGALWTLRPFTADELAAYVATVAGGEAPQALVAALLAQSGGNPLYARELVRHVLEDGKIAVRDGRLASDSALAELDLPPSLRHVVRQRVKRLAPATIALVRAAAVIDRPADLALLGGSSEAADEALAAGVLRSVAGRYELSHAVLRRAIYDELGPDRAARAHRLAADALAARPGSDPAELAGHYHASRDLPGAEAGAVHAIAAAEAARAAGAVERVAAMLAIACELRIGDHALGCRLAIARAEAGDIAGALEIAQRLDDPRLFADVARALDTHGAPRSTWGPLVAHGLAAVGTDHDLVWARLALLDHRPIPVLEGPVWVSRFGGFDPEAVARLRAEGDERDFASTVEPNDARTPDDSTALAARARTWRDPAAAIRVLDAAARDLFFGGADFRGAIAIMDEVYAIAERAGALAGQVTADVVRACAFAVLGELDAARSAFLRAATLSVRLGAMHRMNRIGPLAAETALAYVIGFPAFAQHDLGAAAQQLIAIASSPHTAGVSFGIVPLGIGLFTSAFVGDRATAERLAPHHLRAIETMPSTMNEWGATRDCAASALWRLELRDLAPRLLAAIEGVEVAGCACWSSRDDSLARMHALAGDLDAARRAFAAAREDYARTGRTPLLAITDLDEARAFALAGRRDDADVARLLDDAARGCRALGMTGWLDEIERLRRTDLPDGLSPREVEVLTLLAGGLANKEIAARLFVSVPTVERHIANVYKKIGVHGRAAATAYALRKKLAT